MVADAGLEARLEEGLAVAFFAVALAVVLLLPGVFFAFETEVFEAGFRPITSCCDVGNMDTGDMNNIGIPSWQCPVEKTQ